MIPNLRPCAESSINVSSRRRRVSSYFAVITQPQVVR
jgi:hypothetical protein